MKKATLLAALVALCMASLMVRAAVADRTFAYRGRLENNGSAVTGNVTLVFRVYSEATGGTQVGPDLTFTGVPVTGGEFAVNVGPLTDAQLAASPMYLDVTVNGVQLGSRQRVSAVPYAMRGRFDGPFTMDLGATVRGVLVVEGVVTVGVSTDTGTARTLAFPRDGGDDVNAGKIVYKAAWDPGALSVVGAGNNGRRINLYDNVNVNGALAVGGAATVSGQLTVSGNLRNTPVCRDITTACAGSGANGDLVFLDQHPATCTDNEALTAWRLLNCGAGGRVQVQYRCCDL